MIVVTGASGFIGRSLCKVLLEENNQSVRAIVRNPSSMGDLQKSNLTILPVGDFTLVKDWSDALMGPVECVVHCAARSHVLSETESSPLDAYRMVNRDVTLQLFNQAAKADVKRFIYISSIGVNGVQTNKRAPFSVKDTPAPVEDYALSKYETETALWDMSEDVGVDLVVVRPPLVYGAGNPGNFLRLLKLIDKGIPLPLASIANKRSFVGIENLIDLLLLCIKHPNAAGQTFLVSDSESVSTPELFEHLAKCMGKKNRLFPFPVGLLKWLAKLAGKGSEINRLTDSLQVDSSDTQELLQWVPPVSLSDGLRTTAQWYVNNR